MIVSSIKRKELTIIDENMRNIQNIENRYGLIPFRMGLIHLMEIGSENMNDAAVEDCIKQIIAQGERDRANRVHSIMSPDFQCHIVRCAAELSQFSPWTLFTYVKKHVYIDTD